MINISTLFAGSGSGSDTLRYGEGHGAARTAGARRPVVVWTMSRRCNLRCRHCYTDSGDQAYPGELSVAEGRALLEDLARFQVPAVLLSGGEPLLHPAFFELATYANSLGLRLTLSTNGTKITAPIAQQLREIGFRYVGISLDGIGADHDKFRGKRGAFDAALAGIRHLKAVGQRVGIRFTLTRKNVPALPKIFELAVAEGVDRICFYHLVYAGRGSRIAADDLPHAEAREALDQILAWANTLQTEGRDLEVLTVDNPADGVYGYLQLRQTDPARAEQARQRLAWNTGAAAGSGTGLAHVDATGAVHADQFSIGQPVGNVRERPFSEIWADPSQPLLAGLRDRLPRLTGRCGSCQWKSLCGGGFRARAMQATGDLWASDPACYLSEEEITCS